MCGLITIIAMTLPVVEILLLAKLGGALGFFPTVGLVILTAVIGLRAVDEQKIATLRKLRSTGLPKKAEMLEAPLLMLAALGLLLPGFITDTMGAVLLIPPVRRWASRKIADRIDKNGGPGGRVIVIR